MRKILNQALGAQEHQPGQCGHGEADVWGIKRGEREIIQALLGYFNTLDFIQCHIGNL